MATRPVPPIDYTNLGYASLREAMLGLARDALPEWTDFTENDLGVLLVELFAYASDITLYYQTRIASNLFPATADEPDALLQLLRLIGYELQPPTPATADLRIAFDAAEPTPVTVPAATVFSTTLSTGEKLTFETVRDVVIADSELTPPDPRNLRHYVMLPVVQGRTVAGEVLTPAADGSPNQAYTLVEQPVIARSIVVAILEAPGVETRWREVDTLAGSTPAERDFVVQRGVEGSATILFGDGTNGMIPPLNARVVATYRVGGGPLGNVPSGTRFRSSLSSIREAVNPEAAAGGAAREDLERARRYAPRLYRTQERAVTLQDYVDLALQVPGVGKARAVTLNWNEVLLFIAPSGQVAAPSELLERDLLQFFERRRMASTLVRVVRPTAADIYLRATVHVQPYYLVPDVVRIIEAAVAEYLAFEHVDFGQPIYLSRVYDVIQSLPQVASVLVTEFSRQPDGTVDADGIIELAANELPRPGYRDNPPTSLTPALRTPILILPIGGVTR